MSRNDGAGALRTMNQKAHAFPHRFLPCLLVFALVACNSSTEVQPGRDAGAGGDAGPSGDAMTGADGGVDGAASADAGGQDGSSVGTTPIRWDLSDFEEGFCRPLEEARCEAYASCGCTPEVPACSSGPDIARCLEQYASLAGGPIDYWDGRRMMRLRDERIALYQSCLSLDTPELLSRVRAAIVMHPDLGEPCQFDDPPRTCAEGAGVCLETCQPIPEEGDSCLSGRGPVPCALPAVCSGGVCTVPGEPGDACADHDGCHVPARCLDGVCRILGGPDGPTPCTADEQCAPRYACVEGQCVAAVACDPVSNTGCGFGSTCGASTGECVVPAAFGEGCDPDHPGSCDVGLDCDSGTATCVTATGTEGDACRFRCAEGFVCVMDTCHATVDLGEPCDSPFVCVGGYCDADSSTCVSHKGVGEPCAGPVECDPPTSYCDAASGTCVARGGAGSGCDAFMGFTCALELACDASGTCVEPQSITCEVNGNLLACGLSRWCRPAGGSCECTIR